MTTLLRDTLIPLSIAATLLSAARLRAEGPAPVETAVDIKIEKAGHLFFEEDELLVTVTVAAGEKSEPKLTLKCSLTDIRGKGVSEQNIDLKLGATRTANLEFSFGKRPRGYYEISATVLDGGQVVRSAKTSLGVVRAFAESDNTTSPLGICLYYHDELGAAARAGIKWVRLDFPWPHSEWKRDTFTWHVYDPWVKLAKSHGMSVHAVLVQTPAWASSAPEEVPEESEFTPKSLASYRNYSWAYPPKDLEEWKDFVTTVVGRYRETVKHWEIWNEADFIFWWGSYEQYVELLKVAYGAAKAADPNCQVLLAGPAWIHNFRVTDRVFDSPTWLRTCLKDDAKNYADILNFHSYGSVSYLTSKAGQIRSIALSERCDKPLWCTETGRNSGGTRLGELHQCEYLVKACVSLLASGAPRMYWWEARDDPIQYYPTTGLFREDYSPKPLAVAVNVLLSLIEGSRYARTVNLGTDIVQHQFVKGDSAILVMWRNGPPAEHALLVGSDRPITVVDSCGGEKRLKPTNGKLTLEVSRFPVFVVVPSSEATKTPPVVAFARAPGNILPGRATRIPLVVTNPFQEAIEGRVQLVAPEGCSFRPEEKYFRLGPRESAAVEFSSACAPDFEPRYQKIHASTELSVETAGEVRSWIVAPFLPALAMSLQPLQSPIAGGTEIIVDIRNQTRRVAMGSITAQPSDGWQLQEPEVQYGPIQPFRTGKAVFKVRGTPVKGQAGRLLTLSATGLTGGVVATRSLPVDFAACTFSGGPVKIDGDLSEWQEALPMHLSRLEQASREPMQYEWAGPADLSATILTMWDEGHLYLAVRATDDSFCQEHTGSSIWQGDSFQFAIDTGNERSEWQDGNDCEVLVALTEDGPANWVWFAPEEANRGRNKHLGLAIRKREDGGLNYEMAIPLKELGLVGLREGMTVGFSALYSDNDGFGRRGWLGWASGIGLKKSPKQYGSLVLVK